MHLDQPVPVGVRAEDDEIDEVVELLELGPLAEVLRVLHGQRVKAEWPRRPAQQRELVGPGAVKVQPEEPRPPSSVTSVPRRLSTRRMGAVLVDEDYPLAVASAWIPPLLDCGGSPRRSRQGRQFAAAARCPSYAVPGASHRAGAA